MPTNVVMPALELAQESGKVLRWLKAPGDRVVRGEPLVEIETDKVTTEIEAPASGVLGQVTAREGDVVPVGRTIAVILEAAAAAPPAAVAPAGTPPGPAAAPPPAVKASPLARRTAELHGVDLAAVPAAGGRIQQADVLAHLERRQGGAAAGGGATRRLASPKARRLAAERGLPLDVLQGSGPGGAVLAADVLAAAPPVAPAPSPQPAPAAAPVASPAPGVVEPAAARPAASPVGTVWRIMAERMTASWTSVPHFYLFREVDVSRLSAWRDRVREGGGTRVTYTDLLVKLVAAALARHPGVNAAWRDGAIVRNADVDVGLAVVVEDGLMVPVLRRADTLGVAAIAEAREDLVRRARAGRLRPADIQGGGFTISNLGMHGIDAFHAIVNPPQAAILAVGRIADRVVAVNGQPTVRPTMMLTLSCDHRALDGASGARFLATLAGLIEEPLALLV
jgi:pyruvate dehydrogenase E2 component (dihydrolipoamide acetyltransferase)